MRLSLLLMPWRYKNRFGWLIAKHITFDLLQTCHIAKNTLYRWYRRILIIVNPLPHTHTALRSPPVRNLYTIQFRKYSLTVNYETWDVFFSINTGILRIHLRVGARWHADGWRRHRRTCKHRVYGAAQGGGAQNAEHRNSLTVGRFCNPQPWIANNKLLREGVGVGDCGLHTTFCEWIWECVTRNIPIFVRI